MPSVHSWICVDYTYHANSQSHSSCGDCAGHHDSNKPSDDHDENPHHEHICAVTFFVHGVVLSAYIEAPGCYSAVVALLGVQATETHVGCIVEPYRARAPPVGA